MTRIAHLTDLHLLEDDHRARGGAERVRLSYVSLFRPLDAAARRHRFARALDEAWAARPDHLVITGDLTEDGAPAQFEVLAELLSESRFPAERVTLVPGNHDAYAGEDTWDTALVGPLAPFAATSRPGAITVLGGASIIAVSTAFHQRFTASAGRIAPEQLLRVASLASDPGLTGPLVLAQHHPPLPAVTPIMQWIDGLRGHEHLGGILADNEHTVVLHGHTHLARDRRFKKTDATPRVFSAEAVVTSHTPLRLYEATATGLSPVVDDLPLGHAGRAIRGGAALASA